MPVLSDLAISLSIACWPLSPAGMVALWVLALCLALALTASDWHAARVENGSPPEWRHPSGDAMTA